jgi:hypothetical protein
VTRRGVTGGDRSPSLRRSRVDPPYQETMRTSYPFRSEGGVAETVGAPDGQGVRLLTPDELAEWLAAHEKAIAQRWLIELRTRGDRVPSEVRELLRGFLELLVRFLPPSLGAYRTQVEPLFQQAAELYGNLGAHRGLVAGEAVEEFQLLREVLLRFLYTEPPGGERVGVALREMLQLSRFVDLGVTYASVGHTDTLFFHLLHGGGAPVSSPTQEVLDEVTEQIGTLAGELDRILSFGASNGNGHGP